MVRCSLSVLGLLVLFGRVVAGDSWVGKIVIIKTPGVTIHSQAEDAPESSAPLDDFSYLVRDDSDGQLAVRSPKGVTGWFDKADAVLPGDAESYFTGILEDDPKDFDALCRRAASRRMLGKLEESMKDADEAIRLKPKKADGYLARGHVWLNKNKKEYGKAIADYEKAHQLKPKSALVLCYLGTAWLKKSEPDKALEVLGQALKGEPNYLEAYTLRGHAYSAKKDFDKAIAEFNEVARLDPDDVVNHFNRGKIYADKKDYDKAIDDFDEAVRIAPTFELAYMGRALTWHNKHQYDKALADLEQILDMNPQSAHAYNQIAWICATCPDKAYRDGKRAVEAAKKAVEIGKEAGMMDTLAAAYAELGDYEQAVRYQEQALQDPQFGKDKSARQRLELYRKKMPYREGEEKAAGK